MTTDITELAQLRAELSNPAIGTNSHLRKVALSLVETLEGKERTIQVLESSYNEQTEALEKATKTISELQSGLVVSDFKEASKYGKKIQELQSRIAELESRTVTVKLPRPGFIIVSGERVGVYMKADVDAALAAAGIKVEAE
ncbi:hypothetical protein VSO76_07555 [Klebsiella pneumoniae]|uniref:hypothetical protein n=1 Tax=Klebsiella pneumoniae TaxID=573 RepID=UPI002DBB1278|nr:hypothetical protein [Klebsiella pneumoniae]MEC4056090.1 hypothetical protein [Klebsiella pneumoniae]